jgi:hypothetical protein
MLRIKLRNNYDLLTLAQFDIDDERKDWEIHFRLNIPLFAKLLNEVTNKSMFINILTDAENYPPSAKRYIDTGDTDQIIVDASSLLHRISHFLERYEYKLYSVVVEKE